MILISTSFQRFTGIAMAGLSAALLASCATPNAALAPDQIAKVQPTEGLVVATFQRVAVHTGKEMVSPKGTVALGIRGAGAGKESIRALIKPRLSSTDPDERALGRVVVIALPAGTYEFHELQTEEPIPPIVLKATKILDTPRRFDVRPGKTTYLGRVTSFFVYAKTPDGTNMPTGWGVNIGNRLDADTAIITKLYPDIPASAIRISPLSAARVKKRPTEAESDFADFVLRVKPHLDTPRNATP